MIRAFLVLTLALLATPTFSAAAQEPHALEDEFFELMWLCDSRVERERDDAQNALTRRFAEFEPVWQDRTFLTDGEVAEESRRRFELAEQAWRRACVDEARNAFDARWSVAAPVETDGAETRAATIRLSWRVPIRFVWLAPDFRDLLWREPETGRLWRPRALFSAPEILPEFERDYVDIDVVLEPDPEGNDETESAPEKTLAFDALMGVDPRTWEIPIAAQSATPKEYRSGELTLRGANAERKKEKGGWLVSLRLEYDAAFDAFDSHRSWYDVDDFRLVSPEFDEPVKATRLRARERGAKGERVELEFAADPRLDEAFQKKDAVLFCRPPRFFVRTRVVL